MLKNHRLALVTQRVWSIDETVAWKSKQKKEHSSIPSSTIQAAFAQTIKLLLAENQYVLQTLAYSTDSAFEKLANEIIGARRIFVVGEGRSGLAIRMAAMRLMHLGYQVYVVGETTTPSIQAGDLLIACSGSGKTTSVCANAEKAKAVGAYLIAITADATSVLAKLADLPIELAAATKQDFSNSRSQQFAGSLFEQSTLLLFDALFHVLSQILNKQAESLWTLHTNLE